MHALKEGSPETLEYKTILEKAERILKAKEEFSEKFFGTVSVSPIIKNGQLCDFIPYYTPDWSRLETVIERTAKGLYFHHYKDYLLDKDYLSTTISLDRVDFSKNPQNLDLLRQIYMKGEKYNIGELFDYTIFISAEKQVCIIMTVYKHINYASFFNSMDKNTKQDRTNGST